MNFVLFTSKTTKCLSLDLTFCQDNKASVSTAAEHSFRWLKREVRCVDRGVLALLTAAVHLGFYAAPPQTRCCGRSLGCPLALLCHSPLCFYLHFYFGHYHYRKPFFNTTLLRTCQACSTHDSTAAPIRIHCSPRLLISQYESLTTVTDTRWTQHVWNLGTTCPDTGKEEHRRTANSV